MRSTRILIATLAALLVAPQLALASDADEQIRQMNERMAALEDRLQATQDELDASTDQMRQQEELIDKAGIARQAQSGLSAFLSETQFSGYLAASWAYNFTRPDSSSISNFGTIGGENSGSLGLTAPYHSNHNSFQVDQFFLSMIKPATAEDRAGWGAELVWGVGADALLSSGFGEESGDGFLGALYQAYVEYLADVGGNDVNFKLGRWETPIGIESFREDRNWQITRGLLWSLQPINHTGLMISGQLGDTGIDYGLGVANSFSATMSDRDNEKTFVGHLGYSTETFTFGVNGLYGGDPSDTWFSLPYTGNNIGPGLSGGVSGPGTNKDKVALLDVVATWDPTENLSAWVNFDYWWTDNAQVSPAARPISSMTIWGIAAATRYAITEATGASVRFEWLEFNDADLMLFREGFPTAAVAPYFAQSGADARMWSLTGTLDHALTDNLTGALEVRWDNGWAQGTNDRFFVRRTDNGNGCCGDPIYSKENQILGLLQMMYRF